MYDNDGDGIIRGAIFGFTKGQAIEYKARMMGDWSRGEFPSLGGDGNRKYTLKAGKNNLVHLFSDEVIGVEELPSSNSQLSIFPNPSNNGYFTIYIGSEQGIIRVYTITGELVFEQQVNQTNEHISASQLSAGIYLVAFEGVNNRKMITKLVVQ